MDYANQFVSLVKKTARKNQGTLPEITQKEIEAECWVAVAAAIHRWDGSKGKLYSWVYTAVIGRMKDLRKRPTLITTGIEDCFEFSEMENDNDMEDDIHALYSHFVI
jgi:DNA-directed RNA polymerase specialized sigma24 family protein